MLWAHDLSEAHVSYVFHFLCSLPAIRIDGIPTSDWTRYLFGSCAQNNSRSNSTASVAYARSASYTRTSMPGATEAAQCGPLVERGVACLSELRVRTHDLVQSLCANDTASASRGWIDVEDSSDCVGRTSGSLVHCCASLTADREVRRPRDLSNAQSPRRSSRFDFKYIVCQAGGSLGGNGTKTACFQSIWNHGVHHGGGGRGAMASQFLEKINEFLNFTIDF